MLRSAPARALRRDRGDSRHRPRRATGRDRRTARRERRRARRARCARSPARSRRPATVDVRGTLAARLRPRTRAARRSRTCPKGAARSARLTVWENLQLGGYLSATAEACASATSASPRTFRGSPIGSISRRHAQRRRAADARDRARAMLEPKLLLLDEPSLGLGPKIVHDIFALLRTINERDGVTIVVAEQNATVALAIAAPRVRAGDGPRRDRRHERRAAQRRARAPFLPRLLTGAPGGKRRRPEAFASGLAPLPVPLNGTRSWCRRGTCRSRPTIRRGSRSEPRTACPEAPSGNPSGAARA